MISFFNYLKMIEREITEDTDYFTEASRTAIQRLIGYIESGEVASGEATAFICKRWRLGTKDLVKEWKEETGVDKSSAAFRSQICTLSQVLYTLFPEEAFGNLLADNNPERINQTLDALAFDSKPFCTLYPELTHYAGYSEKSYTLEELESEIKIMGAIKRVEGRFESMDPAKIGYIKRVLDDRTVNNPNKAPLLKALSLC